MVYASKFYNFIIQVGKKINLKTLDSLVKQHHHGTLSIFKVLLRLL